VAVVLFLLGGLFAIYQGVSKLGHPHELASPAWAIGVLLVGILLEGGSFRIAVRESNALRGQASWWNFVRRSKVPELPIVLLEDAGALIGLVLALLGVGLTMLTGNSNWDAVASIAIGSLLCVISLVLAIEMKSLLIGESASDAHEREIEETIASTRGVKRVIHMRTLHIGPEQVFVGAKLELATNLDVAGVARVIDAAEDRVRERLDFVSIMYLEPDLHDPTRGPSAASRDGSEES
jgi:divalent metal cation (Fe/Co/Zn/Cd) transporter